MAFFLPRSEHIYVTMLAALKAGAAYVPLDIETPADRVAFILRDCGAKCLVTLAEPAQALDPVLGSIPVVRLDADEDEIAAMPSGRLGRGETGSGMKNLAYMIYTSGTTGRPKGVQIEHRNAVSLVRAEQRLYKVNSLDRVLQLASPAFDASVEEIWMAFLNGGTLVAGTKEIIRSGREFPEIISRLGVTVLSCVPTFLSMVEADLPTVRLLILGGETCPPDIAARWSRPNRVLFNTYGPTEATVIATASVIEPGRPVTIGRPIANYRVFLLDECLEPVPPGEKGEICIAGDGVARGYLNRPELQSEKFVTTDKLTGVPLRLYRTADLGRFNADGDIEYLGRSDDQVKLRGYRIELSEIEAVLLQCPGVLAAAAALHPETQRIAAYIVPSSETRPDRAFIRQRLSSRLPPYMVPAFLDEVERLPQGISGKIDRKALPAPKKPLRDEKTAVTGPRGAAERAVAEIWAEVLKNDEISVTDDFFLDLDGHSVLAALVASRLRRVEGFSGISIADLYGNPTIEKLARLAKTAAAGPAPAQAEFHVPGRPGYLACAAGQAAGIFFLSGLYAWQWLGAFLTYGYLVVADWPVKQALLGALAVYLVTTPVVLALSIGLKWLLLGRVRPGTYPLWGWFYLRFWFVRAVVRTAPVSYLAGTPLLNVYYRLMGANIGRDVFIGEDGLATFDVFTAGDGSTIGLDTTVDGATVENGTLKIAPVTIGRGCAVGNRCALGGGTVMEDGSCLGDLSMLPDGTRIPAGEFWRGSPAAPAGLAAAVAARPPWGAASWAALTLGIFLVPLVPLAAIFPGLMAITHLGHMDEGFSFLVVAPLIALSFVCLLCVEAWAVKRLLLGRIREGRYAVDGSFYIRKWFFDQIMNLSLEVTGTLYTTLYLRPWLNSLGAKFGPRSEISTIRFIHPDLLEAGAECFLADDVSVGAPEIRGGWMTIKKIVVGDRTFVGNSALLPPGASLAGNVLIGVLSVLPGAPGETVKEGTSWLGSPAINLPSRLRAQGFSEEQTYRPSRRLVALRLFIEFFRIILPSTLFVVLASLIINATDVLQDYIGLREWLALLPLMYMAAGVLAVLATLLFKKVLVGTYRKEMKPLWCAFVWRSELVTGLYENLSVLFFLDLLRGTPFIAYALRPFGLRAGRRCYIDSTWFTEFDLIELGDDAALNENANIQTHLFEDRVMKIGSVKIGARCAVGTMSTVLYDTEMKDGSSLGDLSLLMKGETLPAGTRWHGIPSRSAPAERAPV